MSALKDTEASGAFQRTEGRASGETLSKGNGCGGTKGAASAADRASPEYAAVGRIGFNQRVVTPGSMSESTMEEAMSAIKSGRWKEEINVIRKVLADGPVGDEKQKDFEARVSELKKTLLPAYTFNGTFTYRSDDKLKELSSVVILDFDDVEDAECFRRETAKHPYVLCAFISPTGTGVKVVVRLPAWVRTKADFDRIIMPLITRVERETGRAIDKKCKDVSRACFASHDPGVYHNPNATPIDIMENECIAAPDYAKSGKKKKTPIDSHGNGTELLRELVMWAVEKWAACGYPSFDLWQLVIGAVSEAFGSGKAGEAVVFLQKHFPPNTGDDYHKEMVRALNLKAAERLLFMTVERFGNPPADLHLNEGLSLMLRNTCRHDEAFHVKNVAGDYDALGKAASLKNRLKVLGARDSKLPWETASQVDALVDLISRNYVREVIRFPHLPAGIKDFGNYRILVPSTLRYTKPAEGDCTLILDLLNDALGEEQALRLKLWIKHAYAGLVSGVETPGQTLVISGLPEGGKTLLGKLISTIFGNSCSDILPVLQGQDRHGKEAAESVLHKIDDQLGDISPKGRALLAAAIKNRYYSGTCRYAPMYNDSMTIPTHSRLMVLVNDSPCALQVLPPLTDDIRDKTMLLKWQRPKGGVLDSIVEQYPDRGKRWERLAQDLPAFVRHFLSLEVPPELADDRSLVKAYRHPDLVEALEITDIAVELKAMLKNFAMAHRISGTATEIMDRFVHENPAFQRRLLQDPQCAALVGTALRELAREQNSPVEKTTKGWRLAGCTSWENLRQGTMT